MGGDNLHAIVVNDAAVAFTGEGLFLGSAEHNVQILRTLHTLAQPHGTSHGTGAAAPSTGAGAGGVPSSAPASVKLRTLNLARCPGVTVGWCSLNPV